MQTDILKNVDELSPKARHELKEQITRVQKEAKHMRRSRGAGQAQAIERQRLLEQVAHAGKEWGQGMLQRSGKLTSTAAPQTGTQWRASLERGRGLVQDWGQRGNLAAADWKDDTAYNLRKQGQYLSQNISDWGEDRTHDLRRQGQHLAQHAADWKDDRVRDLRKQGRQTQRKMADWGDDFVYGFLRQGQHLFGYLAERRAQTMRNLRKQGRKLGRDLAEYTDETMWQLGKRGKYMGRDLVERKDEAAWQLHKQGRQLGRNLANQKDLAAHKLRKRGRSLTQNLNMRNDRLWQILGFLAGLLLAGGVTYWWMKRAFRHVENDEERQIELQQHEPLNDVRGYRSGTIRYGRQSGTAVATKPGTSAEAIHRFVGVLSTRQYYPIELQPDANDLVFFTSEDEARAEGFTEAR